MVVRISSKYMGEVLFLEPDSSLMYSFVIRKGGSYVVRDQGGKTKAILIGSIKSLTAKAKRPISIIQQLTAAMNAGEEHSVILKSGESRQHLHCTSLPYCEWYLVTVLPFDGLDISKIESGKMTLNVKPMSLRELMDSIINIIQPQVKAKNSGLTRPLKYEALVIQEDISIAG